MLSRPATYILIDMDARGRVDKVSLAAITVQYFPSTNRQFSVDTKEAFPTLDAQHDSSVGRRNPQGTVDWPNLVPTEL